MPGLQSITTSIGKLSREAYDECRSFPSELRRIVISVVIRLVSRRQSTTVFDLLNATPFSYRRTLQNGKHLMMDPASGYNRSFWRMIQVLKFRADKSSSLLNYNIRSSCTASSSRAKEHGVCVAVTIVSWRYNK